MWACLLLPAYFTLTRQIRLLSLAIAASIVTSVFTRTSFNLLKLPSRASKAVGDPSRWPAYRPFAASTHLQASIYNNLLPGALNAPTPLNAPIPIQSILAQSFHLWSIPTLGQCTYRKMRCWERLNLILVGPCLSQTKLAQQGRRESKIVRAGGVGTIASDFHLLPKQSTPQDTLDRPVSILLRGAQFVILISLLRVLTLGTTHHLGCSCCFDASTSAFLNPCACAFSTRCLLRRLCCKRRARQLHAGQAQLVGGSFSVGPPLLRRVQRGHRVELRLRRSLSGEGGGGLCSEVYSLQYTIYLHVFLCKYGERSMYFPTPLYRNTIAKVFLWIGSIGSRTFRATRFRSVGRTRT